MVSENPHRQAFYEQLIAQGVSHNMAEMCALQQPPGTSGTERAFMEGAAQGKRYMAQLGRKGFKPGTDPEAWVSGVDDLMAKCKARNMGVEMAGRVKHKAHEVAPPPPVDLAPDIVRRLVKKEIAADPGIQFRMKPQEIVEKVKDKAVPPWKKKRFQ